MVKNLSANVGDARERSSIPASGRSPGVGNGNPLLYSCLENSIDRVAWWAPVRGAAKSWTRLSDWVHAPRVVYSDPYQRSLSRNHLVAKNRNPLKVTRGGGGGNGIYWKESGLSKGKVHQSSWMRRERGELGGGKSKKSFSPLCCYILVFSALCASVCAGSTSLTFTIGVLLCLLYARKTVPAPAWLQPHSASVQHHCSTQTLQRWRTATRPHLCHG